MDFWLLIAMTLMGAFILLLTLSFSHTKKVRRSNFKLTIFVLLTSVGTWFLLKQEPPKSEDITVSNFNATEYVEELQDSLRLNPNQAEVWFQLGGTYVQSGDYHAALTCFDYAIRLSDNVTSGLYSAKASALYYLNAQTINKDVRDMLDLSLALDPNDRTALILIASDHFISSRYEESIVVWNQLLDSNQQGIDRISLIHSINQAKQLMSPKAL